MSHAYTSLLMGVAILVSEILLLAKTVKFPFPTMDYIPYSWFSLRGSILRAIRNAHKIKLY